MAKDNSNLGRAKKEKFDEFYTQLRDIENELKYFRKQFKGKVVLCNCDDPFESNFFKYFALNFNKLGLKKLIATCYAGSPIAGQQLSLFDVVNGDKGKSSKPYKAVVTAVRDATGDGAVMMDDVAALFRSRENTLTELQGNGAYDSPECLELLEEADVVVTNPPFSTWIPFVQLLMEHNKKFLIIGSLNAITYKEVFPLLKENKMWLGEPFKGGNAYFQVPDNVDISRFAPGVYDPETKLLKFRNVGWYTNLDF